MSRLSLIFLVLLVPEIRMADRQKRPRLLVPVLVGMEMLPQMELLQAVHLVQAADRELHCKHGYR